VLAKGKQLFEQLIALENTILDEQGNRLGLKNFDIVLMVAGTGKTTTTTPIYTGRPGLDPVVAEDLKFDLDNAVITLTAHEIKDLQLGVSLKDIYTGRRLAGGDKPEPKQDVLQSLVDAEDAALGLFK
jgi:hypothetical protein